MKAHEHVLGIVGAGVSVIGALTPSDLAAYAGAFCGVCTGIFYATKTAVFLVSLVNKLSASNDLSE